MADTLFRDFLLNRINQIREEMTSPEQDYDTFIEKAREAVKINTRIKHIDNPGTGKKKAPEAPATA